MKRTLLFSLLLLLVQSALGQMIYNYSSYTNISPSDGSSFGHHDLYVSAVLDGSSSCRNFPPCLSAQHQGKVQVQLGGHVNETDTPYVTPSTYISISASENLVDVPDGTDESEDTNSTVQCTFAGLVFAAASGPSLISFGEGSELLENLSGPAGIPGSCIKKGGVLVCDWEVVQWCTNQPTYSTNAVTDVPPGLVSWWSDYWCMFIEGHVSVCRPVPGTAVKSYQIGPADCPNPVP